MFVAADTVAVLLADVLQLCLHVVSLPQIYTQQLSTAPRLF